METNKVTIGKLVEFSYAQHTWLGGDPSKPQNPANLKAPIADCIRKVMPGVRAALTEWNKLGEQYNKETKDLRAEYANTIKETENSGAPGHIITEYLYDSEKFNAKNDAIQAKWTALEQARKSLEAHEVEVEIAYSRIVPPIEMLPAEYVTAMRGIVIDPEYVDKNTGIAKI